MGSSVGNKIATVLVTPVIYPAVLLFELADHFIFRTRKAGNSEPTQPVKPALDAEIQELEIRKSTVLETLHLLEDQERVIRDAIAAQEKEFVRQRDSALAEINRETAGKKEELLSELHQLSEMLDTELSEKRALMLAAVEDEIAMKHDAVRTEIESERARLREQLERQVAEIRAAEAEKAEQYTKHAISGLEQEIAQRRAVAEEEIRMERERILADLEAEIALQKSESEQELMEQRRKLETELESGISCNRSQFAEDILRQREQAVADLESEIFARKLQMENELLEKPLGPEPHNSISINSNHNESLIVENA
jgi:hypothetical protein